MNVFKIESNKEKNYIMFYSLLIDIEQNCLIF